ncbi:HAD family phosphatase [Massilia sp. TS11]|uniref:HAD family hydrolase n=1 Tax=Massilia sp. TS11 TaxID=2908003 RepID=UPI001EDB47F1|nr:HAD family phosphatase [Massilia sp. TS11]MCG2585400.1 HAD family phosphatase [Massilia sp. TS11]
MIRALLFDNDGVLVDTEGLFFEVNRELLAELGVALSERMFLDWYLRDNCGAWHLVDGVSPERIAVWRAERNRRYSARLAAERIVPIGGIGATLAALAHLPKGVVTSANREHFDQMHADLGLRQHFDFVLTAEDYARPKPHPEPYLRGLAALGLAPHEVLVVEDSPRGLQAAQAAGLRCVVLRHRLTADHDFSAAWRVIDRIDALPALVEEA